MKRSRNTARPRWSVGLPSRSNSMMSSAFTNAGASERDIKKRLGLSGWRTLTCPNASSTPCSARMRFAAMRSSITAALGAALGPGWAAAPERAHGAERTAATVTTAAHPRLTLIGIPFLLGRLGLVSKRSNPPSGEIEPELPQLLQAAGDLVAGLKPDLLVFGLPVHHTLRRAREVDVARLEGHHL